MAYPDEYVCMISVEFGAFRLLWVSAGHNCSSGSSSLTCLYEPWGPPTSGPTPVD